jgi:hypothetical protein
MHSEDVSILRSSGNAFGYFVGHGGWNSMSNVDSTFIDVANQTLIWIMKIMLSEVYSIKRRDVGARNIILGTAHSSDYLLITMFA